MRGRRQIDWLRTFVWGGIAVFTVTVWTLAAIGADAVLGGCN